MASENPQQTVLEGPHIQDDDDNPSSSSTKGEEEQAQDEDVSCSSASSDEEPPQQTPDKPQSPTTKTPINDSFDEEKDEEESDGSPLGKPKHFASPSKPTVVALASEKERDKRPLEMEEKDKEKGDSSKKPRKGKEESVTTQEEGAKKQAAVIFQRLYSEDDEIAILKGMIEYREKKCVGPMTNVDDVYAFIKDSLEVDVSRDQFVGKIRRLKRRHCNAVYKKLKNPHEIKVFEWSRKIWDQAGNENSNAESNRKNQAGGWKIKRAGKGGGVEKNVSCKDVGVEMGEDSSKERLRKKGLKMMGAKARAEMREMWDAVVVAQLEVDEMRYNVLMEENRRILGALKSSEL